VFYSPWLLPVYKYKAAKNDIETHKAPTLMLLSCWMLILLWGIFTTMCVKPIYIGVCITIIAEIAIVQFSIYLIYSGSARRDAVKDFIDQMVVKQAWLDSKANFVSMLGINTRDDYISYETWWRRRFHLTNYIRCYRGESYNLLPVRDEFHMDRTALDAADDKKAFHRLDLEKWVDTEIFDLDNISDMLTLLYETDIDMRQAYMNELELIIQFQLVIVQLAGQIKKSKYKYLFNFIKEKQVELYVFGIHIHISQGEDVDQNYAEVVNQLQAMSPDKLTVF